MRASKTLWCNLDASRGETNLERKVLKVCKYRPHMTPISNNVAEMSRKKSPKAECLFLTIMESVAQVIVASEYFQWNMTLWREPGKTNNVSLGTSGRKSTQRTLTMSNGQKLLFAVLSAFEFWERCDFYSGLT